MQQRPAQQPWWRSLAGVVTLCLLAAAGLFLISEHTSHVFGALPYLLLAACPLMHLFMHHGHHGSHGHSGGSDREHEDEQITPAGNRGRDRLSRKA